jgi:hypothetical protein
MKKCYIKGERNIVHTIKEGKAKCIRHILRRNNLQEKATEGKGEGKGRRRRRRKQLPDDLRKQKYVGNSKSKHRNALYGELSLKVSLDLS